MMNADQLGGLPESIYGTANGSYVPGMATAAAPRLYADCATVTDSRVDFHCTINSTSSTVTLNGSVSRAITGPTRKWHVDLSMSANQSTTSTTINTTIHLGGDVTVTGNQITGGLSMDANVHLVSDGRTVDVEMNSTISYNNIVYEVQQACATSGNIVIELDGSTSGASVSQAVRYTFTGCHTFTIAVAK